MSKRTLHCGFWPALFALWATSAVQAQVPSHPVDGSFIKEWLVLGPFPSADLGTDFLAEVGGEAGVAPRDGDSLITADGDTLVWRRYSTRQDHVDLAEAFGNGENVSAYAYCLLNSEIAGEVGIDLRSFNAEDAVALWLNGEWFGLDAAQGANRLLIKLVHDSGRGGFSLRVFPPNRAVLAGAAIDATGEPVPYADMRLERDGTVIAAWQTDYWGEYEEVNVYPAQGPYDLTATQGTLGVWHLDLDLQPGDRRTHESILADAVHIAGTLMMVDGFTPHVAVPVQALRVGLGGPEVVATTLSDKGGRYQFVNLKPGRYMVRCQILGGYVYYAMPPQQAPDRVPPVSWANDKGSLLDIGPDTALAGVDFRFAPFKKGVWRTYNALHGLDDSHVYAIHGSTDGVLWAGTREDVYRFSGMDFEPIGVPDTLSVWVNAINSDPEGTLWIGSEAGVYRYQGSDFFFLDALSNHAVLDVVITADAVWFATDRGVYRRGVDGSVEPLAQLADIRVTSVYQDADETLWFGTDRGVFRYDGRRWQQLGAADGLAADFVTAIDRAPDGALWFATAGGASRYDPLTGAFDNLTTADGLVHRFVSDLIVGADGVVWLATDGGVSRYDGQTCVNFTTADGLAADIVFSIYRDREGHLWFATEAGGVSRYDEQTFVNISTRDGFIDQHITTFEVEPDGTMWFGTGFTPTSGQGLFRYDGREFVQFTTADGLAGNSIRASARCPDGSLWFGSTGGGASRYDGVRFENLTTADGLASDYIESAYCDPDGVVWFGLGYPPFDHGGKIARYDGESFVNLTHEDGLPLAVVFAIHRDPDGVMWFGSGGSAIMDAARVGGVSRYDGETLVNLPAADGWPEKSVLAIHGSEDGTIWFGGSSVYRYDGRTCTDLFSDSELVFDILGIYRAANGMLWFGNRNGVIGYDGENWTRLDTRDGLAHNQIMGIFQDAEGALWFCTAKGLTRYRRSEIAPDVQIDYVRTDEWRQTALGEIPAVPTNTRVTIGYHAIDFKTVPEKRQYRYRIKELDNDWRQATNADAFEWQPEASGTYTFEVQAIDRDLRYSESAIVAIRVTPQYGQIALWSSVVVLSLGLVLAGGYGFRRRRERDQIREQLVAELGREMQTAHELQMSLMPTEAPQIAGLEVAGQCIPATEVGGDTFQYFAQDDKFALSVADVTGHGMQAAVPVMTFSGILNTEMQYGHALEILLAKLNQTLHQSLQRRTFICFAMGEYYPLTHRFRVSSCGLPYPCHFQAATQTIHELKMDAFPLGIRPNTTYEVIELQLQPDDRVIFFSDGLVEVSNPAGDFFGFERILAMIRQGCSEGLSAQDLLQRIFAEVEAFSGEVAQEDDQTLVVLHVDPQH